MKKWLECMAKQNRNRNGYSHGNPVEFDMNCTYKSYNCFYVYTCKPKGGGGYECSQTTHFINYTGICCYPICWNILIIAHLWLTTDHFWHKWLFVDYSFTFPLKYSRTFSRRCFFLLTLYKAGSRKIWFSQDAFLEWFVSEMQTHVTIFQLWQ